jgi:aminotransferase
MTTGTVKESVIRTMTRLANEYKAVNLSQGFPNEAPPWRLKLALARAVLSGQPIDGEDPSLMNEENLLESLSNIIESSTNSGLSPSSDDLLNQYSPPMGRPDLRNAIAEYYQRFYQYQVSPEDITVTLGATEAFASALRTVGRPGYKCVVFEPFHELYPSQCKLWYLDPIFVTLSLEKDGMLWTYDEAELEDAMKDAKILCLNSPHNPTGKVFTRRELEKIVSLCIKYDVSLLTDEIYEHMCFDDHQHFLIPKEFPEMKERTLICNSLGKSASATGWRLGWCLHPPHLREAYRSVHDQLAVMSPHPMQYATLSYLTMPDHYFESLAGKYQQRVEKLSKALSFVGFKVVPPQGTCFRNPTFVMYKSVFSHAAPLLVYRGILLVRGLYQCRGAERQDVHGSSHVFAKRNWSGLCPRR